MIYMFVCCLLLGVLFCSFSDNIVAFSNLLVILFFVFCCCLLGAYACLSRYYIECCCVGFSGGSVVCVFYLDGVCWRGNYLICYWCCTSTQRCNLCFHSLMLHLYCLHIILPCFHLHPLWWILDCSLCVIHSSIQLPGFLFLHVLYCWF